MRYFLDTEFYEDGRTIDLISLAIVAEDGREFYAVNSEAELTKVDPWVRENVLPSLPTYGDPAWMSRLTIRKRIAHFVDIRKYDEKLGWFDDRPEFWAYYGDYDWVCLCQLFGTMINLPKTFPKFCLDLKQLSVEIGSPAHPVKPEGEHNALIDARWNRDLYKYLRGHQAANAK